MTIKKIEDLKKRQIICRYTGQVKDCLGYFKQLGFKVEKCQEKPDYLIIYYSPSGNFFSNYNGLACLKVEFYNKKLVRSLIKLIKEKEKKEKIEDFEVDNEGRILKINNWEIREDVFYHEVIPYLEDSYYENVGVETPRQALKYNKENFEKLLNLGLLFNSEEALERYLFKLEIETNLKDIANRLNGKEKIDWDNSNQIKFNIYYSYDYKALKYCTHSWCKDQGVIYCLDKNFLEVAEKEIGEDRLIKYFTEE